MSHDSNNEQERPIDSDDDEVVRRLRSEYSDIEENDIQNQSENNNIQNMKSQQIYNKESEINKKNLDKNSYIKNIGDVEPNHKNDLSHQNYLKNIDNNIDSEMIPSQKNNNQKQINNNDNKYKYRNFLNNQNQILNLDNNNNIKKNISPPNNLNYNDFNNIMIQSENSKNLKRKNDINNNNQNNIFNKGESNSININNNHSSSNDIKNSLNEFSLFNKENIEDYDNSNILNSQINKNVQNNNQTTGNNSYNNSIYNKKNINPNQNSHQFFKYDNSLEYNSNKNTNNSSNIIITNLPDDSQNNNIDNNNFQNNSKNFIQGNQNKKINNNNLQNIPNNKIINNQNIYNPNNIINSLNPDSNNKNNNSQNNILLNCPNPNYNIIINKDNAFFNINSNNIQNNDMMKLNNKNNLMNQSNNNNFINNNLINTPNINKKNIPVKNEHNQINNNPNNNSQNNIKHSSQKKKFYSYLTKAPKTGLFLMGDTSYLNAVLQILGNISSLADYFLNLQNYDKIKEEISKYPLSFVFCRLILHLYQKNEKREIYKPESFLEILGNLNFVFNSNKRRNPNDLLLFILETIHKELNYTNYNKQVNNNYNKYDKKIVLNIAMIDIMRNYNSIISQSFNWLEIKESSCKQCGQSLYKCQFFNIFELDFLFTYKYKKNPITIYDCLKIYENPKSQNFFCEICRGKKENITTKKIYSTPNIFIFSLDRKNLDNNYLQIPFIINEKLDLSPYIEEKEISPKYYEIIGIMSYFSKTNSYISFCRSPVDNQWYLYNNENVEQKNINQIINLHNDQKQYIPCALIYKKYRK